MNREAAEAIYAACESAVAALSAAEQTIREIDDPAERARLMQGLGMAIAEVLGGLRAPAVRQYPDLEPLPEFGTPDTALDADELAWAAQLRPEDIEAIDRALLAECAPHWRKVARVVGSALVQLQASREDLPLGYLAVRVGALVSAGKLESQGNLAHIRFSEVRSSGVTGVA